MHWLHTMLPHDEFVLFAGTFGLGLLAGAAARGLAFYRRNRRAA